MWHCQKAGAESALLQREAKPILRRYAGIAARYRYGWGLATNLLKIWLVLWTFAARPGV